MSQPISAQDFVQQRSRHPSHPDLPFPEFDDQYGWQLERETMRVLGSLCDSDDPRLLDIEYGPIERRRESARALIRSLYGEANGYVDASGYNDEAYRRVWMLIHLHRMFPILRATAVAHSYVLAVENDVLARSPANARR